MKILNKIYQRMLIDAMRGMSLGLFATLICGTLIELIGVVTGGTVGSRMILIGDTVKSLMGMGIGIGVATKLSASPIVYACAAVVGHIGAFSGDIFYNMQINASNLGGSPVMAFIASYVAVEASILIAGKTKVDYLIVPAFMTFIGSFVAIYSAKPVLSVMEWFQVVIEWGMDLNPIIMSIIISMLMGLAVTLPINSFALAITLNLTGKAAGAATIGCCAYMIGFAVASFRDNRFEGFILQSIGSPILQMPNIIKNPYTILPVVCTSAIIGPIAVCLCDVTSTPVASGVGSCGLMAQVMLYKTMMNAGINRNAVLFRLILVTFILPSVISWIISEVLRKRELIKDNDMTIVL